MKRTLSFYVNPFARRQLDTFSRMQAQMTCKERQNNIFDDRYTELTSDFVDYRITKGQWFTQDLLMRPLAWASNCTAQRVQWAMMKLNEGLVNGKSQKNLFAKTSKSIDTLHYKSLAMLIVVLINLTSKYPVKISWSKTHASFIQLQ